MQLQAPADPRGSPTRGCLQVNDEIKRYNGMLAKFQAANDDEWEAIVAINRGDLQRSFFEHMQCLMAAEKVCTCARRAAPVCLPRRSAVVQAAYTSLLGLGWVGVRGRGAMVRLACGRAQATHTAGERPCGKVCAWCTMASWHDGVRACVHACRAIRTSWTRWS